MNRAERRRMERDARRTASERLWLLAYFEENTGELIGGALVLARTGGEAVSRAWSLGLAMDAAVAFGSLRMSLCSHHVDVPLSVEDVLSLDPTLASMPHGECADCGGETATGRAAAG